MWLPIILILTLFVAGILLSLWLDKAEKKKGRVWHDDHTGTKACTKWKRDL